MKFSEDILKNFNLEAKEERMPVNVMQVKDMLSFLKECAERLVKKSRIYQETEEADLKLDCIDIVTAKLNDFSQAFRDIVIFMRKEEGTYNGNISLRYCVNSYETFGFLQEDDEKEFLKELVLRNEIIHDYFNHELHQQKLIWIMEHCSGGAVKIYLHLQRYCEEKGLLEKYADKNRK